MANISVEAFQTSRNLVAHLPEADTSLASLAYALEENRNDVLPEPGSNDAEALVTSMKPMRFAYLARAIKVVLDEAFITEGQTSPFELPTDDIKSATHPWQAARHHMESGIYEAFDRAAVHEDYIMAQRICRVIGYLNPRRFISLDMQLTAGTQTACNAMIISLMNMPRLIEYHAPGTPEERIGEVAARSSGIVYELMRRSVNSLMTARAAITKSGYWDVWADYKPECFHPLFINNQLHSLQVKNIEDLRYEGTRVGDCTDPEVPDIGCPLTLLHGTYKQLWTRTVQAVDKADLWSEA